MIALTLTEMSKVEMNIGFSLAVSTWIGTTRKLELYDKYQRVSTLSNRH